MKALEVARHAADIEGEARWLATIAQTLMQYGQTNEAIRAVNDALAITRRMPDESLQADLLTMLGQLYLKQDRAPRRCVCSSRSVSWRRPGARARWPSRNTSRRWRLPMRRAIDSPKRACMVASVNCSRRSETRSASSSTT